MKIVEEDPTMSTMDICMYILKITLWVGTVSSVITFIYGVVSWCLIKKFRNFRNYVLLGPILAITMCCLAAHVQVFILASKPHLAETIIFTAIYAFLLYFALVFYCFFIVLCYIFYVDYVKVLHLKINNKYLICSLFVWCFPFVEIFVFFLTRFLTNTYLFPQLFISFDVLYIWVLPLLLSVICYFLVVYSVFCGHKSESWTSIKRLGHFGIATFIFAFSNFSIIVHLSRVLDRDDFILLMVGQIQHYMVALFICIYLIVVRRNRILWGEFLNKKPIQTSTDMS